MTPQFILYVQDQHRATVFWSAALDLAPILDEPGMTEFELDGVVLGLMPEDNARRLLRHAPDPSLGSGVPRAEIYLRVEDVEACFERALAAGAQELAPPLLRAWGDVVGYCLDPDGHVLAFATRPPEG